jgi:hypothetical protein
VHGARYIERVRGDRPRWGRNESERSAGGHFREGGHSGGMSYYQARLASLELFRLIMLRRVKRLYSLLDLSSHLNS